MAAALLALGLFFCTAAGQPYGHLAWVRSGSTLPAVFTLDGGRTFKNVSSSARSAWHFGLSSPTGGSSIIFSRDAASGLFSMQMFSVETYSWAALDPGLPPSAAAVYAGDMNVNRAAWIGVRDSTAGYGLFLTNGSLPFFSVPAVGCATPRLSALGSLPSLNALAAAAEPPYSVSLWKAAGCQGELDLVGGSASQVWSFASSPISAPYSVTAYVVLAASGPIGCGAGAACPSAGAGGRLYSASVAGANDAALLNSGSWASFAMPRGGGVNLVACHFSLAPSSPTYCFAAASWNPPAAVYSGVCNAAATGYSFYTAFNNNPSTAGSWAEVGCAPLVAQSLAVTAFNTVHAAGFALGGGSAALVSAFSADSGATWAMLSSLPDYLDTGRGGSPVHLLQMGFRGGPVVLGGGDPSTHCTQTGTPTGVCPLLDGSCSLGSSVLGVMANMATVTRGEPGSVAYLGTFVPSGSHGGTPFMTWSSMVCNGRKGNLVERFLCAIVLRQQKLWGHSDGIFPATCFGAHKPISYLSRRCRVGGRRHHEHAR